MSKLTDPIPPVEHECPKCREVLQPLSSGIPHYCREKPAKMTNLERTVNRKVLADACGRMMFCPECDAGYQGKVDLLIHKID